MSFSFGGPPKTASGFTLPSATPATTAATTGLFGGAQPGTGAGAGDNKSASTLFSTPVKPAASAPGLTFSLGGPAKTSAASLSFGAPAPQATQTPSLGGFGFGASTAAATTPAAATTASAPSLQFSFGGASAAPATTPSTTSFTPILGGVSASASTATSSTPASTGLLFGVAPTASAPKIGLSAPSAVASSGTTAGFGLGGTTTMASVTPTQTTAAPSIPLTGTLTFAQLEDSINKWTIDLEEQGKFFVNQAKQLNAWDTLLISNGEKILNLNSSIEKVKQQQSQLDQELDFILAQQKELEELIGPLEKELVDIPVADIDRNQMYQFAEVIDSQLKQILDDLKEIIENINESNRDEEVAANPITQISKILNAHMGSLEWLDTNTAQISRQLDELTKLEESTKKNLSLNSSSSSIFM